MRILALETTGQLMSVAACLGGLMAEAQELSVRAHGERILPLIDDVRSRAGWAWLDIELVVVTTGPGGQSSIRAGLAVAKAMALATGASAMGISTFEALAHAVGGGEHVLVLLEAPRDHLVVQAFVDLDPRGPAELCSSAEAISRIGPKSIVAGAATALSRLSTSSTQHVEARPSARYAAMAAMRRLSRGERPGSGTDLRPLYLRPPDVRADAGRPLVGRAM